MITKAVGLCCLPFSFLPFFLRFVLTDVFQTVGQRHAPVFLRLLGYSGWIHAHGKVAPVVVTFFQQFHIFLAFHSPWAAGCKMEQWGGCHRHSVIMVRHIACGKDAVQLVHHAFHLFLLSTGLRLLCLVVGCKGGIQTSAQLFLLFTQTDDKLRQGVLAELWIIHSS